MKQQSRSASAPDLTANGWHGADANGYASSAGDHEDGRDAGSQPGGQSGERRVTVELTAVPGEEGDRQVAVSLSLQPGAAPPNTSQHSPAADVQNASCSASALQHDAEDGPVANGFALLAAFGTAATRSASPFQRLPAPPPGADRQTDAAMLHEKVRASAVCAKPTVLAQRMANVTLAIAAFTPVIERTCGTNCLMRSSGAAYRTGPHQSLAERQSQCFPHKSCGKHCS